MDIQRGSRRLIVGRNTDETFRWGIHREPTFTAIGLGPVLVGYSSTQWPKRLCSHKNEHFDRSICACGCMHYFCGDCGVQLDECWWEVRPSSGSY